MRFALFCATALCSAPLSAATVITGTITPDGGLGFINNGGENGPVYPSIPDGGRIKVSLEISNGVIAAAESAATIYFSYDDYDAVYTGVNNGNGYGWAENCFFNGSGPDGCFDGSGDPSVYRPSKYVTGLTVGQTTASYSLYRPKSFDFCDGVTPGICSNYWDVLNDYGFTVYSQRPFSYKITYSDTIGSAVPEPASWAMMIVGFGMIGSTLRQGNFKRRHSANSLAAA